MKCALPSETSWSAFDNSIDMTAYERICNEFNVSVHEDFRQKFSANNGLGTCYLYWTYKGYHPLNENFNPATMSFTQKTTNNQ